MIYKLVELVYNLWVRIKFNKKKVFLTQGVIVNRLTKFEGANHIKKYTNIKNATIGFGTYIGERCNLHGAKIGRYCSIANDVSIVISDHPIHIVSTHPCFHRGSHPIMKKIGLSMNEGNPIFIEDDSDGDTVKIGSDVWIGESVKIFKKIKIGDGAIIGAGAIVTKDIPPYSVCVGVPAKVIKYRFDREVIDFFLVNKWWDKPLTELYDLQGLFLDVSKYIDYQSNIKDDVK
jgi:acetyltransferase-like isoleucine patch superfamily enzyme